LKHLPQRAVPPPGPDFQRYLPHPPLPYSVEAPSSELYTQSGEGSSTVIILSAH
jgi:hypothetical protein